MLIKHGRFGDFLSCSGYPDCKNVKPLPNEIGVKCPECGRELVKKRSRKGRVFYGCSNYPNCKAVFWNKPVDKKCPKCGNLLTEDNNGGLKCSNSKCDYKE